MSWETAAALLIAIAAFLTAISTNIKSWLDDRREAKKEKPTIDNITGQAAEYDASAASQYRKLLLDERADNAVKIEELTNKIEHLQSEFDALKRKLDIYENWNTRLQAQVISMDGVPVPMIVTKFKENKEES